MSPDLAKPVDQSFTWLYGNQPFGVSHDSTKFGCDKQHGSGDIMIIVYAVILQDQMIKDFFDFMSKGLSR